MAFLIGAAVRAGKQVYSAHADLNDPSRPDAYTDRWGNPRNPGKVYEWARGAEIKRRMKKQAKLGQLGSGFGSGSSSAGPSNTNTARESAAAPRQQAAPGGYSKAAGAELDRKNAHETGVPTYADAPPAYSPSSDPSHRPIGTNDRKQSVATTGTSKSTSTSNSDSDSDDDDDDDGNDADSHADEDEYRQYSAMQQQNDRPQLVAVPNNGLPQDQLDAIATADRQQQQQQGSAGAASSRPPVIRYPEGLWLDKGLRRQFRKENKHAYRVLKKQRRMEKRMVRYERRALKRGQVLPRQ